MERFLAWRDRVADGDSERAIAVRMGIGNNKVGRHLRESDPPVAETVIDFARAYGANPVDGLVAAGLVARDEALRAAASEPLRAASELQLLEELTRRARGHARTPAHDQERTETSTNDTEQSPVGTPTRKRWRRDTNIVEGLLS